MTKPRRRPDRPQKSAPIGPAGNGNREGDASLSAAVRALLGNTPPAPAVPPRPAKTLHLHVPPGVTMAQASARVMMRGLSHNAVLIEDFSAPFGADADLTVTVAALEETVAAVQRGELGDAEALLMAQAVTLNTIFARCALQAARHLEVQQVEGCERYLRLALRAQGQGRATIETLALLKNPTTIFTRQANLAQGPQQVNNTQINTAAGEDSHTEPCGDAATSPSSEIPKIAPGASRARAEQSGPSKLLS